MNYTIAQLILLFFIYSFLGWCVEVAFAACKEGRFVNRGFLNGPLCPIYGFGVVLVVLMLEPFGGSLPMLFLGSIAVTTAIEFAAGFLLEKLFHAKWWDYSDMPMNIGGYVCPLFSLMWGLACLIVVRFVHPPILWMVHRVPDWLMTVLLSVLLSLIFADIAATVAAIRKLNDKLKRLSEIAAEMHALSDEIGMKISARTLHLKNRVEDSEGVQRLEALKSETEARFDQKKREVSEHLEHTRETAKGRIAALRERFSSVVDEKTFGQTRLLNAFPGLRSVHHQESLNVLRRSLAKRRARKKKK